MKDRIICIVGPSGSGKTTVAQVMEKALKYNVIQSYTTRGPREANEYGHTFVDDEAFHAINETDLRSEIIAYSNYKGHHYWSTRHQYKGKGDSIYIIDPKTIYMLKQQVKDEVIVIYLYTDRDIRFTRLLQEYKSKNKFTDDTKQVIVSTINQRLNRELEQYLAVEADLTIINNSGSDISAEKIHEYLLPL